MSSSKTRDFPVESPEKEVTEEQKAAICYKSKLLNKYFDTYEELVEAEKAYKKAHEKELAEKKEKTDAANRVQDAYKEYMQAIRDAEKKVSEAKNNYLNLRKEFVEKYGSYHQSYYRDDNKECIESDSRPEIFEDFFNALLTLF